MFHLVSDYKVTSSFLEHELGKLRFLYLGKYDRYQCFRRTCCLHLQLLPSVYGMLTFAICLHFDCKSCFICEVLVYKN
jgi:hypothetical protein